ncbi:unnamed protein product [Musa textilis]
MTVSGIHRSLGLLLLLLVDEGREAGKPERRPAHPHRGLEVDLVSLVDAYFGDDGHPEQGPARSSAPSSPSSASSASYRTRVSVPVKKCSYGACCFIRRKPASFTHPHSSRFLTGRTPLLPPASWQSAGSIPPLRG